MAFLSPASHLGSVLLPHDAFQEHAAHLAEWSATLRSKGSERPCIRSGLPTFLPCTFTAHSDVVVTDGLMASEARSALDFPWLPDTRWQDEPYNHIKIMSTISVAWDFTT